MSAENEEQTITVPLKLFVEMRDQMVAAEKDRLWRLEHTTQILATLAEMKVSSDGAVAAIDDALKVLHAPLSYVSIPKFETMKRIKEWLFHG